MKLRRKVPDISIEIDKSYISKLKESNKVTDEWANTHIERLTRYLSSMIQSELKDVLFDSAFPMYAKIRIFESLMQLHGIRPIIQISKTESGFSFIIKAESEKDKVKINELSSHTKRLYRVKH